MLLLQHLKHRMSQLEGSAHQVEAVRQENALLRQQMMDMEAAVRVAGVPPVKGGGL
jgi:hypothetical protein